MKKFLLALLVVFVLIQFIRIDKNVSDTALSDIQTTMQASDEVMSIIEKACADCHSNNTNYPWYGEIAPVSGYLNWHVSDGKKHFNMTEWSAYNKDQKDHLIKDLKKELKNKAMPLSSYTLIHKDAKLSAEEYETMMNWVATLNN